ncbi:alkaline phosphatase family protein [Legionella maioricensis]|uniref:Alkaline phosphatase family protein n=1 Tax=Legionella maioricensis TaxID=2896528 RepID=A0A9X2IAH0_9GAMM|nr:alkaline phosphatase family protein [Legionella maioricensis]MCL9682567.1 alkaline phosphatase family protein [Legionella maioricensis]MCL9686186.1 alkaline phosphatase family protein [Legionella maioricensis]
MKKITYSMMLLITTFISHAEMNQPRLVVQLVVDQLRGDLIHQHQEQFGSNGFNYLLNHGLDYHNAHHPHANTTTCAGHATIATGSYPSMHGVVDNDWYDRTSGKLVYCMEDLKASILPTVHTKTQNPGRSPVNLKVSTLSDEIMLAKKGKAFGVSLKDRAAITLAGHAGKAFWFDKTNGGFVTSDYYYSSYPQWVQEWNKQYKPQEYSWSLGRPLKEYQNANNPTFHHDFKSFGQTFPHHISNPPSQEYFTYLSRTPKADQLTADFAKQLLINEQLGLSANKTDYLAISFSAVDAIGHQFGPNSLEAEDNLLELDKTIANLLAAIDKQVGLDNVLIVLTADHGVDDSPSYLKAHHIHEIKPMDVNASEQQIRALLKTRFHLPAEVLKSITPPYVYLDHQIINDLHLDLTEVSQYVAQILTRQPGVFKAYPLPVTNIEKNWLSAKVDKMAYPYRAGDVYIVQPPYQSNGSKNDNRVTHGSPWRYDSYVPLLFVHSNFNAHVISRPVQTTDIAPTLAVLLMIKQPSGAVGQPLSEVLNAFERSKLKRN